MCGIVGYVGRQAAAPLLLEGLSKLEYRGYDSAGVALLSESGIAVYKEAGRLSVLTARLHGGEGLTQTAGIGHTRWATHGAPTACNAHPHLSDNGKFAVVHNGFIENEAELRRELIEVGVTLRSDTDTELVAQLLQREMQGDVLAALRCVAQRLRGSFALGVVYAEEPDRVYALRHQSPLVIGVGEGEVWLASDVPALLSHTRRLTVLQDGDCACLTADGFCVYAASGEAVERVPEPIAWQADAAERGEFEHFMLKEIYEQPEAVEATVTALLTTGAIPLNEAEARSLTRVVLVGCGSAYHAAMVGAQVMERLARVTAVAEIASEYRYRNPVTDSNTWVICISQSGETADTLAALREAKRRGARVAAVVNVAESTLARESDVVFPTCAGPEMAVATTKAYAAQLAVLYAVAVRLAALRGTIDKVEEQRLTAELLRLPQKIREALHTAEAMRELAESLPMVRDAYFMGRGIDYAAALEGALKLKEISYVHAEAYAAGELKHGTISLVEKGTLVVAVSTDGVLRDKLLANVREVRARGAFVVTVGCEAEADVTVTVPSGESLFGASLSVVPLQFLAYYTAERRGLDIDRPRNLAKSVTVE